VLHVDGRCGEASASFPKILVEEISCVRKWIELILQRSHSYPRLELVAEFSVRTVAGGPSEVSI